MTFVILAKIKEWLECKETSKPFEPLRMTICGMAGTGKSRLINTLVSIIRTMFQHNNTVHVGTPTGASAYNVGGRTIHSLFKLAYEMLTKILQKKKSKRLQIYWI